MRSLWRTLVLCAVLASTAVTGAVLLGGTDAKADAVCVAVADCKPADCTPADCPPECLPPACGPADCSQD